MPLHSNVTAIEDHAPARARPDPVLDAISRIFERIVADASVPALVRNDVARLRIPSLRAARLESGFLVNRSHPVRRLLDAVGAACAGLDETVRADDPAVVAIARAVRDVLTDFDADLAPFQAATAALARFMSKRAENEDAAAQAIVRAVDAHEREEQPRHRAEEEVARRLHARGHVPPALRDMLLFHWSRALAVAHRCSGEQSPEWSRLLQAMDDLLWSVEPKATPDGRRRLAAMLPDLIEAVAAGLRQGGMSEEAANAFLSDLVDCHAEAVKAGLRPGAPIGRPAAASPVQPPAFLRSTYALEDCRVEEIRLAGTDDHVVGGCDQSSLDGLLVGSWIELERGARQPARKRLAWVSPATGACLFIGRAPGSMPVTISPAALAELLATGEARRIDLAPLVDRVMAGPPSPAQG